MSMRNWISKNYQSIRQKVTGLRGKVVRLVVNKTHVKPPRRGSVDIEKWRRAIQSAEGYSQQRKMLYDLYTDIMLDGYTQGVIQKRISQVTNSNFVFQDKDGKVIEEITELTDKTYFENLLKEIINAKFWGHSLIELMWPAYQTTLERKGETILVPRKHVKPRWGIVTAEEFDTTGTEYRNGYFSKSIVEVGEPEDLGLLVGLCQYVIYKRGNFGDWAEFATVFGMPFRHGKYNNEESRSALVEGLEKAGAAGYMVTPEGTELEFHSGNASGNGSDVYRFLRNACNEEIAYIILGNTMTTMESRNSGYAQSKTQADGEDDLTADDRRAVLRVLNEQLIPYLEKQGYPVAGGKWTIANEERISLTERIKIDIELSDVIDIPHSYWYKTYGIPKPTAAELRKMEERDARKNPQPEPTDDGGDNNDDEPKPDAAKKKGSTEIKLNALYKDCCPSTLNLAADLPNARFKPISKNLEALIIKQIKAGNFQLNEKLHRSYYRLFRDFARAGFARSLSDATDFADFELQEGIRRNISRFAAAKQEKLIGLLAKSYRNNPADFDKNAKAILRRMNRTWLQAELNTIEAAANTAGAWQGYIDRSDIYPNLEFNTIGDDRVRPTHAALDRAIYPVNDPFWRTHSPPLDYRCRCIVLSTDAPVKPTAAEPPRAGLKGNPFFDRQLIGDDHPYFESPRKGVFAQADIWQAAIERGGRAAATRKMTPPSIDGKTVTITEANAAGILASESDNEAIRNAAVAALPLLVGEMKLLESGIYYIEILGVRIQFTFDKNMNLIDVT